jgi:hypothetical protein
MKSQPREGDYTTNFHKNPLSLIINHVSFIYNVTINLKNM